MALVFTAYVYFYFAVYKSVSEQLSESMKDKKRKEKAVKAILRGETAEKFMTIVNAREIPEAELVRECIRHTLESKYGYRPSSYFGNKPGS